MSSPTLRDSPVLRGSQSACSIGQKSGMDFDSYSNNSTSRLGFNPAFREPSARIPFGSGVPRNTPMTVSFHYNNSEYASVGEQKMKNCKLGNNSVKGIKGSPIKQHIRSQHITYSSCIQFPTGLVKSFDKGKGTASMRTFSPYRTSSPILEKGRSTSPPLLEHQILSADQGRKLAKKSSRKILVLKAEALDREMKLKLSTKKENIDRETKLKQDAERQYSIIVNETRLAFESQCAVLSNLAEARHNIASMVTEIMSNPSWDVKTPNMKSIEKIEEKGDDGYYSKKIEDFLQLVKMRVRQKRSGQKVIIKETLQEARKTHQEYSRTHGEYNHRHEEYSRTNAKEIGREADATAGRGRNSENPIKTQVGKTISEGGFGKADSPTYTSSPTDEVYTTPITSPLHMESIRPSHLGGNMEEPQKNHQGKEAEECSAENVSARLEQMSRPKGLEHLQREDLVMALPNWYKYALSLPKSRVTEKERQVSVNTNHLHVEKVLINDTRADVKRVLNDKKVPVNDKKAPGYDKKVPLNDKKVHLSGKKMPVNEKVRIDPTMEKVGGLDKVRQQKRIREEKVGMTSSHASKQVLLTDLIPQRPTLLEYAPLDNANFIGSVGNLEAKKNLGQLRKNFEPKSRITLGHIVPNSTPNHTGRKKGHEDALCKQKTLSLLQQMEKKDLFEETKKGSTSIEQKSQSASLHDPQGDSSSGNGFFESTKSLIMEKKSLLEKSLQEQRNLLEERRRELKTTSCFPTKWLFGGMSGVFPWNNTAPQPSDMPAHIIDILNRQGGSYGGHTQGDHANGELPGGFTINCDNLSQTLERNKGKWSMVSAMDAGEWQLTTVILEDENRILLKMNRTKSSSGFIAVYPTSFMNANSYSGSNTRAHLGSDTNTHSGLANESTTASGKGVTASEEAETLRILPGERGKGLIVSEESTTRKAKRQLQRSISPPTRRLLSIPENAEIKSPMSIGGGLSSPSIGSSTIAAKKSAEELSKSKAKRRRRIEELNKWRHQSGESGRHIAFDENDPSTHAILNNLAVKSEQDLGIWILWHFTINRNGKEESVIGFMAKWE